MGNTFDKLQIGVINILVSKNVMNAIVSYAFNLTLQSASTIPDGFSVFT